MNEHTQASPYAGEPDPSDRLTDDGNPYLSRRVETAPDLDAAAPVLRAHDLQRLNRKALGFLAGIVGVLVLMALWIFGNAGAGEDSRAKPRQEKVVIPELPEGPTPAAEGAGGAAPIALEETAPASELPPLPPESEPTAAPYAGYDAPPSPPRPRAPTLLERRVGAITDPAAGDTAQDGWPAAMPANLQPPAAGAQDDGATADATSATYLHNPDALLVRGTYLRCVLETRIITDIPGFTSCIVTEPVYSINGRRLLLPKGSKILGRYDTEPNGPRVAVVWDRITTPNGIDVSMASPGIDNLGGAGHPGHYDAHWPSRISAALMISLVSDAFKYAGAKHGPRTTTYTSNAVVDMPFDSNTARTMERVANEALTIGMRRPATVTINQGTVVNVYVAKDVDFSGVLARR